MRRFALAVLAAALALGARAAPAETQAATSPHAMVAAANPLAVAAGVRVLKAGGSAIDAAVAAQAVLGLVEPQSSGLGGGAFMVYYDAKTRTVTAFDGRETAPAGASPDMFEGPDGRPMTFAQAVVSGRATGAPGVVAMLALAHDRFGARPWSSLFGDAETMAGKGFIVSPRLAREVAYPSAEASQPDVIAYFGKPGGGWVQAGEVLKNPAYAAMLRALAAQGPPALYQGEVAAEIAARVHAQPLPGTLGVADLAGYRPKASPALCRPYRVYVVCVPNDPSGGPALLEALGLLARTDIDKRGPSDPVAWFDIAQAERLMYADRDRYGGDPAFVQVPTQGLLDPAYLDARAALIPTLTGAATAGDPPGAPARTASLAFEPGGTSHLVVVDARGDVLSMTTTVESLFGTGRMVEGFFLNNQLTDFAFSPTDASGAPVANAVAAGKRPRSAMAPVIVTDRQGRFVAALGSPGGPAIIAYDLKALVAVLDWKLPMQEAIALPNLIPRGSAVFGETEKFAPGVVDALAARGMVVQGGFVGENSGLQGVEAADGALEGGADPRREGVARGF